METVYNSCRLSLWIILLTSLHHSQQVSGTSHPCPPGQLIHRGPYYVTCCFPIRCPVGEEVKNCTTNGTRDSCQVCMPGQNQSLRTSSFTMDRCVDWPLHKKCMNPENKFDEPTKRCMCDIEQGQKFAIPENINHAPLESYCQRRSEKCEPGHEPLVDGGCSPCKENYFQPEQGHRLCEPKTNCTLLGLEFTSLSNASADDNCSQADNPVVTIQPPVPQTTRNQWITTAAVTSLSSTTLPTTTSSGNTVNPDASSNLGTNSHAGDITGSVVGSVLGVIFLLVIIIVIILARRKGKCDCMCAEAICSPHPERNCSHASASGQHKRHFSNGSTASYHLMNRHKIPSNGIVPSSIEDLPNGCTNGNNPHGHFHNTSHGDSNAPLVLNHHYNQTIVPMPDILRPANGNEMIGQRQVNVPNVSFDNVRQEKPHIIFVDFYPNPNIGETDEHSLGAAQENQELRLNDCRRVNTGIHSSHEGEPVVRYTTSGGSVIASPEGEVDLPEFEFPIPRLDLLLDGISATDSSHDANCLPFLDQDNHEPQHKPADPAAEVPQQQNSHLAAFVGPVSPRNSRTDQPNHLIMSLKKQDFPEPIPPASDTQIQVTADHQFTTGRFEVEDAHQTQLKTLNPCSPNKFSNIPPSTDVKTIKTDEEPNHKHSELEKEIQKQDCDIQEEIPRGKKSVKGEDKTPENPHVVPFNEAESPTIRQLRSKMGLKQTVKSKSSVDKASGPLRSMSDPEQANTSQACVAVSGSISKNSVSHDRNDVDNYTSNPGKSASFRRSQSQNAPSLETAAHKLPPRSMSEEKPLKPIAKVKPMPTSDMSVNQLPMDTSEATSTLTQQHEVSSSPISSNPATNLSSDSDDSD